MKKHKLPHFKTREEEARFWDTHSMTDYLDELESADEVFTLAPSLAVKTKERNMKKNRTSALAHKASKKYTEGYRCSEAILTCYGGRVGLSREQSIRIGCAFGGGLGSSGDVCGAIAASIVILGLRHGRTDRNDTGRRVKTDRLVQKFLKKFKSKHKHLRCNDLVGFDRSTPAGHDKAVAAGVFKKLCPKYVKDAAIILEELL